ncbi:hypothetical protein SAMN06265365_14316 [Tistlia consotensis]|uniref:Uncharacterized protein n=1 Tax=Tistlia consotensis USBA 355 TaxID=560819 RepID=A0A1Y6BAX3_9PROT|nr:hypothetical protein [Tistlia consotensis]SMF02098.1 hypothetical protein SAMN05428998_10325 [Tistlia consotensis USBA 355]SNS26306.1 hypothetical protein SAMN06265365_14316 [Tistlia consotensis]
MLERLSAALAVLVVPLALASCQPLDNQQGSVTLAPSQVATIAYSEQHADFVCGLDTRPLPPFIGQGDLGIADVGAGFRNWQTRLNLCGRLYSWDDEGLVAFNATPLTSLSGLVAISSATLHLHKRVRTIAGRPVRSMSDGLESTNCPEVRYPTEAWEGGYHAVTDRNALVDSQAIATHPVELYPAEGSVDASYDVTRLVKRLYLQHRPIQFAMVSTSDLIGQPNNDYCMMILGNLALEIHFRRLTAAGS